MTDQVLFALANAPGVVSNPEPGKKVIKDRSRTLAKIVDTIPIRAYYILSATHPVPYEFISTGCDMSYPTNFYRPWRFGRVVLAGDSAHACPSFLAQGAGMGFEDVFELVGRLSNKGVWSRNGSAKKELLDVVFEQYRIARLDRVCFVQRHVINRVSEPDVKKSVEERKKLWLYDPTT